MANPKKIIFLDRDGVLNRMVVHAEHGTIDSPLNVGEVEIFPLIPKTLRKLNDAGFVLAIVTNQPAAAKNKTTLKNLNEVHSEILKRITADHALIQESKICFHRREDNCDCRKPKPGMLLEVLNAGDYDLKNSWMVGDGVTDVQAGIAAGLKTAFLGPKKPDALKIFSDAKITPDFWGESLQEFADELISSIPT